MDHNQLIGTIFMAVGVLDMILARFVLPKLFQDNPQKEMALKAVYVMGSVFVVAGSALLAGWFRIA